MIVFAIMECDTAESAVLDNGRAAIEISPTDGFVALLIFRFCSAFLFKGGGGGGVSRFPGFKSSLLGFCGLVLA